MNTKTTYLHGYSGRESERLLDQAKSVKEIIHHGLAYPDESHVLEAGCGVGAQTVSLSLNSPGARFTSVDISADSLKEAAELLQSKGIKNVTLLPGDIHSLPFESDSFDHIFVCYVLEHLTDPLKALTELRRVLRPGGSITVVEGDHASFRFFPESPASVNLWDSLMEFQRREGGNGEIGREIYPLLHRSDFRNIRVEPITIYGDSGTSKRRWKEEILTRSLIPMVEGVKQNLLQSSLLNEESWDEGMEGLRTVERSEDGLFFITIFKGIALKEPL